MTVTVGEWLGIGGFGLTLAVTLGGVIRWAVKRETEYIRRDELERMETRLKAELGKVASDGQVERDRAEFQAELLTAPGSPRAFMDATTGVV